MEQQFYRMKCLGFVAYCDAFIGRRQYDSGLDVYSAFLISFIGTVSNVKAISASLYSGEQVRLTEFSDINEYSGIGCRYYGETNSTNILTIRTRKIGETVNKIVAQRFVPGHRPRTSISSAGCGNDNPAKKAVDWLAMG